MLFNSYMFIFVFLPVVLAGFFILGRMGRRHAAIFWLIATSLVFYGWDFWPGMWRAIASALTNYEGKGRDCYGFVVVGMLVFSLIFNYILGLLLASEKLRISKKAILIFGLIFNLCVLGFFKYSGFLARSILDMLAAAGATSIDWFGHTYAITDPALLHKFNVILPLGISFYTFQKMAYIIDCYQGKVARYNFLHYCLFVAFFPQLIAGPIVHHKEIIPQFSREKIYTPHADNFAIGIAIFMIGLFKKVMIADNVAEFSDALFLGVAGGQNPGVLFAWIGMLAYAFQIYFDFSGYSDMAIGMARMFGVRLPLNFASPYKSVNIVDFWRRWHMTLSRFLRDYLYIALGGNRCGKVRRYANLMITMLLGGLWHGANWSYMVWGGLHGLYLIINHGWHAMRRKLGIPFDHKKSTWWGIAMGRTLTFLAVLLAWVFFKAGEFRDPAMYQVRDFAVATTIVKSMVGANGLNADANLAVPFKKGEAITWIIALLVAVNLLPNTQQYMARFRPAYRGAGAIGPAGFDPPAPKWIAWRPSWITAIGLAAMTVITMMSLSKPSSFIYWQF